MFHFLRNRRRRRLLATPWPAEWVDIVSRLVPFWELLTPSDRNELQGLVQVFLAEKQFEGCGGLRIDDEVRLAVATQACLLLLGGTSDFFPRVQSVLVYPTGFFTERTIYHDGGLVSEEEEELLGEYWSQGALVLSWQDVRRDAVHPHDGFNIVLHEFAHQLDDESGDTDGAPVLPDPAMYADWTRVLSEEFARLGRDLDRGRRTVLDEYAAENPAEFFAVATEVFFERPRRMLARHRALYEQLSRYFRQDPARWGREDGAGPAMRPGTPRR